jgi:DNA phosphorothioation-associated putative methyltransferase
LSISSIRRTQRFSCSIASLTTLVSRYGSTERIERIAFRLLQPESLASARETKREAILTYLALMQLQGAKLPPFRLLPEEIKADLKMLWTRYEDAVSAGRDFLFQLGKPEMIQLAFAQARVGKRLPEDFYLHRSAERRLPPLLLLLVHAAHQIVGAIDYDVLKIALDGRKVSFLKYRDFDGIGHPELLYSARVHVPTSSCSIRDYSSSTNPPILHRKESLVDSLYPCYGQFEALTRMEEKSGLLSRSDIGTRNGWESLLRSEGFAIDGHRLEKSGVT